MYPHTVQIESPKLKTLLQKKGELITIGRGKSEEIEKTEAEMEEVNQKLLEEEKKVDIQDLNKKQMVLVEQVNKAIEEMEEIKKEISDRMTKQVSQELREKYDELKKKKDDLETDRNKVALKAQKYNDKIIPIGREMMKPFLQDQYDDYDTLQLQGDEIVATIFNHLVDWKANFKKK